jgi:hypothetical protein
MLTMSSSGSLGTTVSGFIKAVKFLEDINVSAGPKVFIKFNLLSGFALDFSYEIILHGIVLGVLWVRVYSALLQCPML